MILEPIGAEAADALAAAHALAFDHGWSARDIADILASPGAFALAVRLDDTPRAFILCRAIAGEAEVLTLAVDPLLRRQGVARALLTAAIFLYEFMGLIAGYYAGRLYKTMKGKEWKVSHVLGRSKFFNEN